MKKIKIVIAISAIALITNISYANTNIYKENGNEYIEIKNVVQNVEAKLLNSDNIITIHVNNNEIILNKSHSFGKINDKYIPLDIEEMNGYKVPKDTSLLLKEKKVYIPISFFKNNKIEKESIPEKIVKEQEIDKIEQTTDNEQIDNDRPVINRPNNRPTPPSTDSGSGENQSPPQVDNEPDNTEPPQPDNTEPIIPPSTDDGSGDDNSSDVVGNE